MLYNVRGSVGEPVERSGCVVDLSNPTVELAKRADIARYQEAELEAFV
jgi:hypothetical protein